MTAELFEEVWPYIDSVYTKLRSELLQAYGNVLWEIMDAAKDVDTNINGYENCKGSVSKLQAGNMHITVSRDW